MGVLVDDFEGLQDYYNPIFAMIAAGTDKNNQNSDTEEQFSIMMILTIDSRASSVM
jgi:hypothetical protein